MSFCRYDFQEQLLNHLPTSSQIQYSKRLQSYHRQNSGAIELIFQDGSTATCDLLIGADGIKSTVRRCFLYEQAHKVMADGRTDEAQDLLASIEPVWTGSVAYRALVSAQILREISGVEVPDFPTQVT